MRVTITYEDGVWEFSVSSDDDDEDYLEVFELTDLREAQDAAWDLMDEITKGAVDPFDDLFADEEDNEQ